MTTEPTNLPIDEHSDTSTSLFTPAKQEEIFAKIKALHSSSGITIQQLSRVTYISERTLSRYFSGKTKDPHFYTLCTIIIALGGDVNEILGISSPSSDGSAPSDNPYGDLILSYRNEAQTQRAVLENITSTLGTITGKLTHTRRLNTICVIFLLVVISVFCILEIVDLCNPDWGRYQWVTDLFGHFLEKV